MGGFGFRRGFPHERTHTPLSSLPPEELDDSANLLDYVGVSAFTGPQPCFWNGVHSETKLKNSCWGSTVSMWAMVMAPLGTLISLKKAKRVLTIPSASTGTGPWTKHMWCLTPLPRMYGELSGLGASPRQASLGCSLCQLNSQPGHAR